MFVIAIIALFLFQQPITPDTPVTIEVGPDPVELIYSSTGDELISITAHDLTEEAALDLMIEVRRDADRMAYHDVDTAPALENLLLDVPEDYVIRVQAFNGAQTGAVEVLLTTRPRLLACEPGEYTLAAQMVTTCQLELEAGDRLTLTIRDTSGTLDPVLRLYDGDDRLVALNDDHATFSTMLNVFDAALFAYHVTVTGRHIVQVSDFSGAAGAFELSLDHAG